MTPEQREYVAEHVRNLIGHDETEGEDSDLPAFRAALAILTPEAEADRRIGAAVRNSAPQSFDLATTLSEAARELDGVQFPIAAGALRAIADALREETGR